jgi:hypothetical protein
LQFLKRNFCIEKSFAYRQVKEIYQRKKSRRLASRNPEADNKRALFSVRAAFCL